MTLTRVATFLRLIDDDGNLSITHLSCYFAIAWVCLGLHVSWAELSGFLIALSSYRVKRYLEGNGDSETVARLGQAVTTLQAEVKKLGSPERLAALRDQLRPGSGVR